MSSTHRPTTNEAYLIETLDIDEGARRLGELGIGCNPGITRYMKNTLFDEKMDGTVHLAVGNSYTDLGGVNESAIHWDLVKDLRLPGSRIELDGVVVQSDGAWLVLRLAVRLDDALLPAIAIAAAAPDSRVRCGEPPAASGYAAQRGRSSQHVVPEVRRASC